MKLGSSMVEKINKAGLWINYYAGYPRCPELCFKSNNWRRLHGVPMKRRKI